jgi:3-oxoacyl-[acyl-carrier-protein] synthase II
MDGARPRIVVTGAGAICAGGRDTRELLSTLLGGRTALAPCSQPSLAGFEGYAVGAVRDEWIIDSTDAEEQRKYGRDELLSLIAGREALRQAGLASGGRPLERGGLVLGKCQGLSLGSAGPSRWIHWTADVVAAGLGLLGPRQTVSTACAAGGNAVGIAMDRIFADDADVVLAGGVDTLRIGTLSGFTSLHAVDPAPCSPYSRSGGLNLGEGAAFLVVERLDHAVARGAPVLAEVLGYGLSADAYHATTPDPTGLGGVLAVGRALTDAGIGPESVSYVNGHGTGTKANDTVERRIMRSVFGPRVAAVPLVSSKSFVGHALGAAGAIEAVISVLSLVNGVIPATVNFGADHAADLDFVPNQSRAERVEVVLSNNYAFGGNNVSVVFAKPGRAMARRDVPRRDAVITGIGIIGRPGIGTAEWLAGLTAEPVGPPSAEADAEIARRLLGTRFAPASAWRQMNDFTRLCTAAARMAVEDSGVPLTREHRKSLGLLLGTAAGSAEFADGAPLETAAWSPVAADPGDESAATAQVRSFTQSTLNAPAGAVCKELGIHGPTTTIVSGGISGTLALEAAMDAICLGRSDAIIVVGVEEASGAIDQVHASIGARCPDGRAHPYDPGMPGTSPGTAAVAVVVEEREAAEARRAGGYARIAGIAHTSDNYHPYRFDLGGERYAAAIRMALARAAMPAEDIDMVSGSATGTDFDLAETAAFRLALSAGTRIVTPKSVTAEGGAASGLLNVALPIIASRAGSILMPRFEVAGTTTGEAVPAAGAWAPVGRPRRLVATSVSFGASFGAVVIEMSNP